MYNESSLNGICATLAYALGIEPPSEANPKNEALAEYIDKVFSGERADRVFMYNPDAVAEWIFRKYPALTKEVSCTSDVEIPLRSVMPSVTPVCFGTMYTGAMPEIHGIQKYEKPVIKIDTIFDALIRAGRRPAIVSTAKASLANIYLERDMDYFLLESQDAVNAKTAELILSDEYDLIVVYNGNYDFQMHRSGPESLEALAELRVNSRTFCTFTKMIEEHWQGHNTLVGFAMDHGCHEIDGGCGSHGLDMEEDINIVHLYKGYKRLHR
jgi:predicted AlkP superfamily pyrophosphatase or phosphodiesterase